MPVSKGKFKSGAKVRYKDNPFTVGRVNGPGMPRGTSFVYSVFWDGSIRPEQVMEEQLQHTDKVAPGMAYRDTGKLPISRTGIMQYINRQRMAGHEAPADKEDRKTRETRKKI